MENHKINELTTLVSTYLNKSEVDYVWKEYREIIKDKIENNG